MKKILLIIIILLSQNLYAESTNEIVINVKGMVCSSCEYNLEKAFKKHTNIQAVKANYKDGKVKITLKENKNLSEDIIKEIIFKEDLEFISINR